jgi:hypothetical protein
MPYVVTAYLNSSSPKRDLVHTLKVGRFIIITISGRRVVFKRILYLTAGRAEVLFFSDSVGAAGGRVF